jgi:hypothetical protein
MVVSPSNSFETPTIAIQKQCSCHSGSSTRKFVGSWEDRRYQLDTIRSAIQETRSYHSDRNKLQRRMIIINRGKSFHMSLSYGHNEIQN